MGPLLRVLLKAKNVQEVPEPSSNVLGVASPSEESEQHVLDALDPDNPYDWEVHGL